MSLSSSLIIIAGLAAAVGAAPAPLPQASTTTKIALNNYFAAIADDGDFNTRESSQYISVTWPTNTAQQAWSDSPWAAVASKPTTTASKAARAVPRDASNYFTNIANDGDFNTRESSQYISVTWPTNTAQQAWSDSPWAAVATEPTTTANAARAVARGASTFSTSTTKIPKNNYFAAIADDGDFNTRESSQYISVTWPTNTAQEAWSDSPWAAVASKPTSTAAN